MAKLDIDFILLDESVVMHGFRALMSGARLAGFMENPVMLIQHNRPSTYASSDDIILPIGMWYDIRVEGDKLLAKPDFDDDDELAMTVQRKVQKGYLKGASVWIEPTGVSDEPSHMLPGQSLPTFIEWGLLEASIVDIPNCRNSLSIRNSAGKRIALNSDADNTGLKEYLKTFSQKDKSNKMDRKLLCLSLGLAEAATDEQITEKLGAINASANANVALAAENDSLKTQLAAIKLADDERKVTDLVDGAINDKKFEAGLREDWITLATANYEHAEKLISKMPAAKTIQEQLAAAGSQSEGTAAEAAELMKLSGRDLYLQGKLDRLKAINLEGFKLKYKEVFGADFSVQ